VLEFGHLGIGLKAVRFFKPLTPAVPILLGSTLPDLIDKPLYYGAVYFTGRISSDIGVISCTRTFGHSGLLLLAIILIGVFQRSLRGRVFFFALAAGMFSHHLLDFLQDAFISEKPVLEGAEIHAFLYPLYSGHFGAMPTKTATDHLLSFLKFPALLIGEGVGILLLWTEWKKNRKILK
jgi:hypothetical protein